MLPIDRRGFLLSIPAALVNLGAFSAVEGKATVEGEDPCSADRRPTPPNKSTARVRTFRYDPKNPGQYWKEVRWEDLKAGDQIIIVDRDDKGLILETFHVTSAPDVSKPGDPIGVEPMASSPFVTFRIDLENECR